MQQQHRRRHRHRHLACPQYSRSVPPIRDLCVNPDCLSRQSALQMVYAHRWCNKCGVPYCSLPCALNHAWEGLHTATQCERNKASGAWAHNLAQVLNTPTEQI